MANVNIYWYNYWDDYTITYSTQHPNFPATHTQNRWYTRTWRSRYGTNSGWGRFEIDATNRVLYFDEGGGGLVANMTIGTYNADTLAAEIETQMEAAGAQDYAVLYNDTSMRFEIHVLTSGGTVQLELATVLNAIWDTIGFDTGVDTAFLASHIADNIRIHTSEELRIDAGSGNTLTLDGFFAIGHNIQTTGTVYIQASNDNWTTINLSLVLVEGNRDNLTRIVDAGYTFRYWRYYMVDIDNPDGYVELGRCFIAARFQPGIGFSPDRGRDPRDPSPIKYSDGGQASTIQRSHFEEWDYEFQCVNNKATWDNIFDHVGSSLALILVEKPSTPTSLEFTNPEDNTYYFHFKRWSFDHVAGTIWKLRTTMRQER